MRLNNFLLLLLLEFSCSCCLALTFHTRKKLVNFWHVCACIKCRSHHQMGMRTVKVNEIVDFFPPLLLLLLKTFSSALHVLCMCIICMVQSNQITQQAASSVVIHLEFLPFKFFLRIFLFVVIINFQRKSIL